MYKEPYRLTRSEKKIVINIKQVDELMTGLDTFEGKISELENISKEILSIQRVKETET